MTSNRFDAIFFILIGLFFALRFKNNGRDAVEQRKKLNRILPFRQSEKVFDKTVLIITQAGFLIIGLLFILVGLAKLIS